VDGKPLVVGVLAVQGDFEKHLLKIKKLGVKALEVRTGSELSAVDALIIPGGESTTIKKVLSAGGMFAPLKEFAKTHPVFGTCAGSIMLARTLADDPLETLGVMDITIKRNAYGSQVDSFIDTVRMNGQALEAVFIRAPKIIQTGPDVTVLITHQSDPVLVRQGRLLACTFHPELTSDNTIHRYFITMASNPA